jgi:hypothetical protein
MYEGPHATEPHCPLVLFLHCGWSYLAIGRETICNSVGATKNAGKPMDRIIMI